MAGSPLVGGFSRPWECIELPSWHNMYINRNRFDLEIFWRYTSKFWIVRYYSRGVDGIPFRRDDAREKSRLGDRIEVGSRLTSYTPASFMNVYPRSGLSGPQICKLYPLLSGDFRSSRCIFAKFLDFSDFPIKLVVSRLRLPPYYFSLVAGRSRSIAFDFV
ncbi:hypothetical protein TWF569_002815 [Orbilia oligospora]|nr:hypothetical protein TWF569_002815 [Orbilia oligospora]